MYDVAVSDRPARVISPLFASAKRFMVSFLCMMSGQHIRVFRDDVAVAALTVV